MSNLCSAGFARLKKDKVFRLIAIVVILATALTTLQSIGSYHGNIQRGFHSTMEEYFFNQAPVAGILTAIFVSLFWGTEYSNGTIRNKLWVGHHREAVYFSHFAVCLTANLTFLVLWFLCSSPMYFFIGPMEMGPDDFLTYVDTAVCFIAAFTALFTLVCSMVTNKAYSVVVALAVWALLQMTGSGIYDRLCEPEIHGPYTTYLNGEFVTISSGPNPLYIGGTLRLVLEGLVEFLPTGQVLLVNDINIWHPLRGIVLSLTFSAVMLFIGVRVFQKKDIR